MSKNPIMTFPINQEKNQYWTVYCWETEPLYIHKGQIQEIEKEVTEISADP